MILYHVFQKGTSNLYFHSNACIHLFVLLFSNTDMICLCVCMQICAHLGGSAHICMGAQICINHTTTGVIPHTPAS